LNPHDASAKGCNSVEYSATDSTATDRTLKMDQVTVEVCDEELPYPLLLRCRSGGTTSSPAASHRARARTRRSWRHSWWAVRERDQVRCEDRAFGHPL